MIIEDEEEKEEDLKINLSEFLKIIFRKNVLESIVK